MKLDLDEQIPEPLYRAVAEVLAFVHFLEQQAARGPHAAQPGPILPTPRS